ncbi:AAA family ATPase [Sporosarcina sp. HYO08]|uniref:ATP-binding protein n=1 Tax=Sporosarcina sp. HYO08 TaxID=1759557 RepID=UPI000794658B|nr:AAA family ATPase [Sporosarcina sp. HYO08]KXH79299.1 hypothetical protein AU377_12010 [Sporosarcina sp. HYO08]
MRVEKIVIYGFGQHENVTVNFERGVNVIYGLNEAGKTTIQQFILHTLFGFPQKNSVFLRYEPKTGGKYGGQVHVIDDVHGKWIVERVRGKSAGDVTVYFEDGTVGDEEDLKELLRHYDRSSFEAIFSFSLLQLQGFEKMDENTLSRTLLASGTTGVDSLMQLESKMEKEMNELFKMKGRRPDMNVKIDELRQLEADLKKEQEKTEEYAPALKKVEEIDERLIDLYEQSDRLQKEQREIALLQQLHPLFEQKQIVEKQLSTRHGHTFPVDGIRRYEIASSQLTEITARRNRIEKDLAVLTKELPSEDHLEQLKELEIVMAKESEWHRWRSIQTALADESEQLEETIVRLCHRIGVNEQSNTIVTADVSLQKEEELYALLKRVEENEQKQAYTLHQIEQLESEQITLQNELQALHQMEPSEEEWQRVREWPRIRQQLAEAKAFLSLNKQSEPKTNVLFPLLVLFALGCLLFGTIQQQWLLTAIGVLLAGAAYFYKKGNQADQPMNLQEMEQLVAAYDGKEQQMEQLTIRVEDYTRNIEAKEVSIHSLDQKRQAARLEQEKTKRSLQVEQKALAQFLLQYGITKQPSRPLIPELFRMVRELQEARRVMDKNDARKQELERLMEERKANVEKLLQKSVPEDAIYEILRSEFKYLTEETEAAKSNEAARKRLKTEWKEATELQKALDKQVNVLYAEAGVETEEAYYHAFHLAQEKETLKRQLKELIIQLEPHQLHDQLENNSKEELKQRAERNEEARLANEEEQRKLREEKAALVHQTEALLSDETYGSQLQRFEMKKAELAKLAGQWSERKGIVAAIQQTMRELKEKKLPKVLRIAERYFERLTGGKYVTLKITPEGRFEAITAYGLAHPISELSQATKEQAYISLRLSLASTMIETAPFPLLMDDPFVHFDHERIAQIITLIESLQDQHQFLYFTCHQTMKEKWEDANILNASEFGNKQGVRTH